MFFPGMWGGFATVPQPYEPKVGDRVRVKKSETYPEIEGREGRVVCFASPRWEVALEKYSYLLYPSEMEHIASEKVCVLPGCRKPNDPGVVVCWGCGNTL